LLAVDSNYWLNLWWHSGQGVEAGHGVAAWLRRTVDRLKERGLTDVVMCFDSPTSFRKELTKDWEKRYKDRPAKDPELIQQLHVLRDLLEKDGFLCVSVDGFEADDLLASYAKQFDGRVTLFVTDKDLRQCLRDGVNMLTKVRWEEGEFTADKTIVFDWLTAKGHTEEGCSYNSVHVSGIRPDQWQDFQAIAGDSTDNIAGAAGIGAKIGAELITEFGSLEAVLDAARNEDERIKPKKREALLKLAEQVDVVRQLVTMRTDVNVPHDTRI
jgi:DNA polymerase-1